MGHAGLWFELGDTRLLCDPWFNDSGAFLGTRHPFPHNTHLKTQSLKNFASLKQSDFIYISRFHNEHYDPKSLKHCPKETPLLISKLADKALKKGLQSLGFTRIIECDSHERKQLAPNLQIQIISSENSRHADSTLIIKWHQQVLINQKNCPLNQRQIQELHQNYGSFHLLLSGFSPEGTEPILLNPDKRASFQRSKRVLKQQDDAQKRFKQSVIAFKPKFAVPFPSPSCFLDKVLIPLNTENPTIATTIEQINQWRQGQESQALAWQLLPGHQIDLVKNQVLIAPSWNGNINLLNAISTGNTAEINDYIQSYAKQKAPAIHDYLSQLPLSEPLLFQEFSQFIHSLIEKNPVTLPKAFPFPILFRVRGDYGGDWRIDFSKQKKLVTRLSHHSQNSSQRDAYILNIESLYLQNILNNRISWSDFFHSQRFQISHHPNLPVDSLIRFLSLQKPSPIQTQESAWKNTKQNTKRDSEKSIKSLNPLKITVIN